MSVVGWSAVYEQGAVVAARHYLGYLSAHQDDFEALSRKRSHVLQAMSACAQLPQGRPLVIACARAAHDYMRRSGQWSLWQPYLRLGVEVAQRLGDARAEADLRAMLASIHHDMGQWAQAAEEYSRAQAFYEHAGPTDQLVRVLVGRAQSERMIGQAGRALKLGHQALSLCRGAMNRPPTEGDPNAVSFLGLVYSVLGALELDESRLQSALEYLKQAQEALTPAGPSEALARNYNTIARVYYAQGHWAAAIRYLQLSLDVQEKLEDAWMEAQTNANLGILHHALGHWRQAENHLRRAIAIAEEVGAAEALANSHGNLGRVLRDLGRWSEALDHLVEALNRGTELGHWRLVGNCYANLACLAADERAWDRALYCAAKARDVADQIGDVMLGCEAELWAGAAYRGKGQLDEAEAAYQRTLGDLATSSLDNRQLQADALEGLAAVKRDRGQPEAALQLLDQALALRIGRSDEVGLLSTLFAMAEAEYALGSENRAAFRVVFSCAEELAMRYDRHDLIARLYTLWGDLALHGQTGDGTASEGRQDLEAAYRAYNYALKLVSSAYNDRLKMTHRDVRQHLRASLDELSKTGAANKNAASRLHNRLLRESNASQSEELGQITPLASNLNRSGVG